MGPRPLFFTLLALLLMTPTQDAQFKNPWRVGAPLPEVSLPTIDGGRLALSELRGKKLLLVEFASW